jgi:EF hand
MHPLNTYPMEGVEMTRKRLFGASALVSTMCLTLPAFAQQAQQARVTVAEQRFEQIDVNADGSISLTEFRRTVQGTDNPAAIFGEVDVDQNDVVSRSEWDGWRGQQASATMPTATEEGGELNRQIEIAVTDETLRGDFSTDAGLIGLDGNRLGAGLLFSKDNDIVISGQLMAPGVLDQINVVPEFLTLSVGGKVMAGLLADPDDDVVGLMPGAEARWLIPLFGLQTWVVGNIFYAPDILSFGDADDILDFSLNYEVQFLENTAGFAGYRLLSFDRDSGGEDDIVDTLQVGVRFTF